MHNSHADDHAPLPASLRPGGAEMRERFLLQLSDALATMLHWRPELLMSDIAMPGEDGY